MAKTDDSSSDSNTRLTPAMRQFHKFKQQHPDCVLFFRMGDFYEMFYEDAKLAHRVLGVTLTERTKGVPMAGVPYHAVDGYLRRMIQAGHRVAVCDQIESPKEAAAAGKKVVGRDVSRVITAGTLTDEAMLEEGEQNILAAVHFYDKNKVSLAWVELSTGTFSLATLEQNQMGDELARINPKELLYKEDDQVKVPPEIETITSAVHCAVTSRPGWQFQSADALAILKKQYQVARLDGFGFDNSDPALVPAGAVVHYLLETQGGQEKNDKPNVNNAPGQGARLLAHLRPPRRFQRENHLVIDRISLRSLEVERTIRAESVEGSLLGVMGGCVTALGKRALKQWICYPLAKKKEIQRRQDGVQAFFEDEQLRQQLHAVLDKIQDIHRITGRLAVDRATPRDLVALGQSAGQITALGSLLEGRRGVEDFCAQAKALEKKLMSLARALDKACVDTPPGHMREGGLVRDGYDRALDESRLLERNSNSWLTQYQKDLIDQTGIPTLKVGFNKVFGYYIEVTAVNSAKVPTSWARKQTLKNAERFITQPLKDFEGKVLTAKASAITREQEIFTGLCQEAQKFLEPLYELGNLVASLDVLACFALLAAKRNYVRPVIVDQPVLDIKGGRHPVLDRRLGDQFVPNDIALGQLGDRAARADYQAGASGAPGANGPTLAMITGPNMAGKSTYIRQAALITLLAHTGSFVPADSAVVGLCDRIFTRIGASDELHTGQSTFMVEMTETANICHHATARSLVILDEIGRGTSTLDGLSLAWSIAEHLAGARPRTLFATHYHELISLAERFENVMNLNVAVREWQNQVVFLHKIVAGGADQSYGIHVAKIAGMPENIVKRAAQLLSELEVEHSSPQVSVSKAEAKQARPQMFLFGP